MTFTSQGTGGNCFDCAWVLAEGVIDEATVERFKAFTDGIRYRPTIEFNSPGGSVLEALELGALIRERQYDTSVKTRYPFYGGTDEFTSRCYSACVYAFIGGVSREVGQDSTLAVHQFFDEKALEKSAENSFTATDLAQHQKLTSVLSEYVRRMGVDQRLVEIASRIAPWEDMHVLSRDELVTFNIDTTRPPPSVWRLEAVGDGVMAAITQRQMGKTVSTLTVYCSMQSPGEVYLGYHLETQTFELQDIRGIEEMLDGIEVLVDEKPVFEIDQRSLEQRFSGLRRLDDSTLWFSIAIDDRLLQWLEAGRSLELRLDLPHVMWGDPYYSSVYPLEGSKKTMRAALRNCL